MQEVNRVFSHSPSRLLISVIIPFLKISDNSLLSITATHPVEHYYLNESDKIQHCHCHKRNQNHIQCVIFELAFFSFVVIPSQLKSFIKSMTSFVGLRNPFVDLPADSVDVDGNENGGCLGNSEDAGVAHREEEGAEAVCGYQHYLVFVPKVESVGDVDAPRFDDRREEGEASESWNSYTARVPRAHVPTFTAQMKLQRICCVLF